MIKLKSITIAIFLCCIQLYACSTPAPQEDVLNGRILFWHEWQGAEAQVLNDLIDQFRALHPNVDVIALPLTPETLINRFKDRSDSGLGPDMLLLNTNSIFELAETNLIDDIGGQLNQESSQFLPSTLAAVQDENALFGVPFTMHSQVLFYNKSLVGTPPQNLTELQERVSGGESAAIDANLESVMWGLGAFGGSIWDEDGQFSLSEGALINWVDFLQQAQTSPGFILDTDIQNLRDLFLSGEVAYYIGPSSDLPILQEALQETLSTPETADNVEVAADDPTSMIGPDSIGVSSLPVGPNEWQPSPILQTDAFVFSRVSSQQEQELALALAEFLTKPQQQTKLAAEGIGRVPASSGLRRYSNLPDSSLALARQSSTALAIPFNTQSEWDAFIEDGSELSNGYARVLQGTLSTGQLIEEFAESDGSEIDVTTRDPAKFCLDQELGQNSMLTLWHSLPASEAEALDEISRNYEMLCPGIDMQITAKNSRTIIDDYIIEAEAGGGPDILLESSRWTSQLAEKELIVDLSDYIQLEDLETLIPDAADSMRYRRRLYGLPQSVSALALLYNKELVDSVPTNLDELLIQVDPEHRWALPMRFFYGYWGFKPFGGFHFNAETGAIENQDGLVPWLTWLQTIQIYPGIDLTFDATEATDDFAQGRAAYLVAGPWVLPQLREELGSEKFGVTSLPNGPFGPGSPILQSNGLMINANSIANVRNAADFARYLSQPQNQEKLLSTGSYVSASVNANLIDYPLQRGFQEAAKLSSVVDENNYFSAMEQLGDKMYEEVLLNGIEPETAVKSFQTAVEELSESP